MRRAPREGGADDVVERRRDQESFGIVRLATPRGRVEATQSRITETPDTVGLSQGPLHRALALVIRRHRVNRGALVQARRGRAPE